MKKVVSICLAVLFAAVCLLPASATSAQALEIMVAYGNRYAPDQFEAELPKTMASCHLAAAGGVAVSTARSPVEAELGRFRYFSTGVECSELPSKAMALQPILNASS